MGTRVVVVGGSGFLGQHIVNALAERGYEPVVLARRRPVVTGAAAERASLVADAQAMSVDEWTRVLTAPGSEADENADADADANANANADTKTEAVVFAAGTDGSLTPPAPAKEFFTRGNVDPVRRMVEAARAAGCRQVVLCGSYFVTMARQHPELRLAEDHPYIESRCAQAAAALEAAGPELGVAVLEIPYVLGKTEGRKAALAPLAPWLRSRWPLFAPPGGTAVVTVNQVAQAVCEAVARRATGRFPVAEANLTWKELFARLAQATGREHVRVHTLSTAVLSALLRLVDLRHRLAKREPGLNPTRMTTLLTQEAYLDPELCRTELGVTPGVLDRALRDTVT